MHQRSAEPLPLHVLEHRVHGLHRQFDTEEGSGLSGKESANSWIVDLALEPLTHIRRNGPCHRRSESMVESLPSTLGIRPPDAISDTLVRSLFSRLELGLDSIGWKSDTPHGDTGRGSGGDDCRD
jgi:hypothetical protein